MHVDVEVSVPDEGGGADGARGRLLGLERGAGDVVQQRCVLLLRLLLMLGRRRDGNRHLRPLVAEVDVPDVVLQPRLRAELVAAALVVGPLGEVGPGEVDLPADKP